MQPLESRRDLKKTQKKKIAKSFKSQCSSPRNDSVVIISSRFWWLCVTVEMEHRMDFELREGLVESRYWSAVTSHTAYWTSHDVALFLLTFIYKQQSTDQAGHTSHNKD